MKHAPPPGTRVFFATGPLPCPYLDGRIERRLVTELAGRDAARLNDVLSRAGFRRSHTVAYTPVCSGCRACIPVRVVADRFAASRTQRRIWRRNAGLTSSLHPAVATTEQYDLFSAYMRARHGDGEMAKMTFLDYQGMVEETSVTTHMAEFRTVDERLVAACLLDQTSDGLSAVYSFFAPDLPSRSLGTYTIMWLIEVARGLALPYVYLGFWIAGSPKMSYKVMFRPLEAHGPDGWTPLENPGGGAE